MSSYIFYTSILIFSTLSAYLYEKSLDYKRYIFYFFAFFIPFIFIAIRLNMGTDYSSYVDIFNEISNGKDLRIEYGYTLLNKLVQIVGLNVQWVFAIMGFFTIYYSYRSLPKDAFTIGVFLFITIYYFQGSYNQIRQGLAVAIMSYAFKYIYEKNILKYILYSVVSSLFHFPTAMILFFIYFIGNIRLNRFVMIAIVVVVFVAVEQHLIADYLKLFMSIFPSDYIDYLDGKFGSSNYSRYGMLMPFLQSLLSIIVFYNKDRVTAIYPQANILINLYLLYELFYLLHFEITIFNRLQYMFVFAFIISLLYFILSFNSRRRVIVLYILSLSYFLIFLRFIHNGSTTKVDSTHINPYKNIIFDKGDQ